MKENLTISEQIGLRLKVLRIKKTFTTSDISKIVNISSERLAKLESGECEQPLNLIARLAMLYDVSLEYIASGNDDNTRTDHIDKRN